MKIILACAAGMSTGMLVQRMQQSADSKGISLDIEAVPVGSLNEYLEGTQIILLGPQVGYLEDSIKSEHSQIPVVTIDMMDYGMMNGEKVLEDAIQYMQEWEER